MYHIGVHLGIWDVLLAGKQFKYPTQKRKFIDIDVRYWFFYHIQFLSTLFPFIVFRLGVLVWLVFQDIISAIREYISPQTTGPLNTINKFSTPTWQPLLPFQRRFPQLKCAFMFSASQMAAPSLTRGPS